MSAYGTRTRDLRTSRSDALTTEPTPPLRNPLLPAEAYATAAPRAPDGRSNPYRNEPEKEASHCHRFTAAIPAGRCGPLQACSNRAGLRVLVLPDRSRTPKKKNPRVKNPRAFASPRGDRGRRSPGVEDQPMVSMQRRPEPQREAFCTHTPASKPMGFECGLRGRCAMRFMSGSALKQCGECCVGGARYARFSSCQALAESRATIVSLSCTPRAGVAATCGDTCRPGRRTQRGENFESRSPGVQSSKPSLNRTVSPDLGTCITMQWIAPAMPMMLVQSTVSMVRPGKACWNTLTACAFCAAY